MKTFDYEKYMKMKWDTEILSYVSKIREYKGKHESFFNINSIVLDRTIQIAKMQSVESSNKIEGIVITDKRIKDLCLKNSKPISINEKEIKGYKDALDFIDENYDLMPLTPNYILQLHKMIFEDTGSTIGGKFKNVQNYINEIHQDGTSITLFVPLSPYLTPDAVDTICQQYNQEIDKGILDPLILIAVFIIDFLCIHPFNDGNGRISRLLTTLLLYKSRYFVGRYISIEKSIEKSKEGYYDALYQSSQGWHENSNDPLPFIKYLLGVIIGCYRELDERIEILKTKGNALDIVRKAIENRYGKLTRKDILELCPTLERSSVGDALKKLVDEGTLKRGGSGKNTYYYRTK